MRIPRRSVVAGLVVMVTLGLLQGCAIVGRSEREGVVRYGLMVGHSTSKSVISLYEGDLPEESIQLIQLWSYRVKKQPVPPKIVASDQP